MHLAFAPLFSGSSGNSTLISCGETNILVDAGVSGVRIQRELEKIGVAPSSISAILVTHEHDDHIKGVGILSRKLDVPIYATAGTWEGMKHKIGEVALKNQCLLETNTDFYFGDLNIMPFATPHDAMESCGYTFEHNGMRFSIATDIGCVKPQWFNHVQGSDAVILESNYDLDMLYAGSYPATLKRRIASRRGHLCNDDAADAAKQLIQSGTKQIFLGHLSKENNFPELAMTCTEQYLISNGIIPGKDVLLSVADREKCSGYFRIDSI